MKKQTKNKKSSKLSWTIIYLLFIASSVMPSYLFAQGAAINSTGVSADPSAMLDVSSTVSGALIPRMTEAQRNSISNPALGLQVFNLTTNCLNIWLGTTWKQLCGDCTFAPPVAGNNGPICQGSTLNLTATTILGATYQWTGPNAFSSTDQNPVISGATASASGTYSVTATLNGCTSSPQSTVAIVNAGPSPAQPGSISGSTVNLGNQAGVIYSISPVNFATTYTWTVPIGASITGGQGGISITVDFTCSASGNIIVTANNACGISPQQTLGVNTSLATTGTISGPIAVGKNSTGNVYSVNPVQFATSYNWTVPAGATITAGAGTNSIIVTFGNSNLADNFTVFAISPCGTGGQSILSVNIGMQTFSYTGSSQTFTVPSGITSITLDVYGAQGVDATYGGKGGEAKGTLAVTSGQVLNIYVGQFGGNNGWNGGAQGPWGSGGGASDVRIVGSDLASRIIVAGGGGGMGANSGSSYTAGGAGGNYTGGTGSSNSNANGGSGGTQLSGGAGGYGSYSTGTTGSLGQGGYGGSGGGGGGGYYGGGGGGANSSGWYRGGGGGGSSYFAPSVTLVTNTAGVRSGDGQVIITW